jgi:hypothetical protein
LRVQRTGSAGVREYALSDQLRSCRDFTRRRGGEGMARLRESERSCAVRRASLPRRDRGALCRLIRLRVIA